MLNILVEQLVCAIGIAEAQADAGVKGMGVWAARLDSALNAIRIAPPRERGDVELAAHATLQKARRSCLSLDAALNSAAFDRVFG